ncbi:MAG: 50S ribosomal protein L15 [Planctomycetes bacterium]|nr:50S ribosomal protein L15 [Planctomycetota bacterium]
MNLTQLKSLPKTRKEPMVRKGRGPGSEKGKTAGRGGKGASARTGFAHRYYFEGGQMPLVRRLPKHGFNNAIFRKENAVLNVSQLDVFDDGATVGPDEFLAKGLINRILDGVKVLGDGEVKKKLTVRAHSFSGSAREKIAKAGGKTERINLKGEIQPEEAPKPAKPKAAPKAKPVEAKAEAPAKAEKAEKPAAPKAEKADKPKKDKPAK